VVAISMKDRSAVLPGGMRPDAAVWFDKAGRGFSTSTFYAPAMPDWLTRFRETHPFESYLEEWTPEDPVWLAREFGSDDASGDAGTIVRWDLNLTTAPAPSPSAPANTAGVGGAVPDFSGGVTLVPTVYTAVVSTASAYLWDLDLTTALPAGLGQIGIQGEFDAKLNSPDWFIDVDGSLLLFGLELLSGSIEIDRTHLRLTTSLDFGTLQIVGFKINLGGLVMDMELDFQTWQFCGTGKYTSNPDANHSNVFDCGVTICIDGEGVPLTPSLGCGNFCLGSEFCAEDEMCVFAQCKPRLADGQACGKNKHCISGNCGCITSDALGVNVGMLALNAVLLTMMIRSFVVARRSRTAG
jgi:hypothetical protein